MAGITYDGVELRKLPPRFRLQISQILDIDNSWKKLMASIPNEINYNEYKYKSEHIDLIERHSINSKKLPAEILMDEWSTSGRIRPTVETLYDLLQRCQLYRAADFVAKEILDIPPPPRPTHGPAQRIPIPIPNDANLNIIDDDTRTTSTILIHDTALDSLLEKLNNYDYTQGNPVNFDMEIIEKATQNFKDPVGHGAFGTVYSLDLRPKGPKLAVKLLHHTTTLIEDQFVTEIRVLSEYRHENVVPLIGFCTNGPRFCLIYEFMSGGNLLDAIASEEVPLDWSSRIQIMFGIICGIHYLHTAKEKPLIHRDIKSANVLLQSSGFGEFRAKIGDFGLAKSLTTSSSNQTSALTSTIFGTGLYMAPEAFRGDISPKMDIFSFGVIVLEILTGLPPYDENREEGNDIVTYLEDVVENDNIFPWLDEKAGNLAPEISSDIYRVALKCLAEKRRRPTSDQIIQDVTHLAQNSPLQQNNF